MKTLILAATASLALVGGAFAADHHEEEAGLAAISSGTYKMDKDHGYVTFSYSHFGLSNPILSFDDVDAVVELVADDPTKSKLTVAIDPTSIDSGVERFNGHLTGENHFNVAEFPEISFKSTALTLDTPTTGTLTGDLTIKGITKPVTLDVNLLAALEHPMKGIDAFGIEATGKVMRSEFGLDAYVPVVSDEVTLHISAEFHKSE